VHIRDIFLVSQIEKPHLKPRLSELQKTEDRIIILIIEELFDRRGNEK